jgi:hypothetical protein
MISVRDMQDKKRAGAMDANAVFPGQRLAGSLLVLSALLMGVGVVLWTGRNLYNWPSAGAASYLGWERGFIMGGMVAALLGLTLLEGLLKGAGDFVVARAGLVLFLVATVLGLAWEANQISLRGATDALIVTYVVLALLGQAAIGLALVRTGLVAGWTGWVTMLWSLGWLVSLPIVSPGDLYYPIVHQPMPLLLGIALLVKR